MSSAAEASDPSVGVASYVVPGLASSPFGGGALEAVQASGSALSELAGVSWWAVGDADLLHATLQVEVMCGQVEAARLALLAEVHARAGGSP